MSSPNSSEQELIVQKGEYIEGSRAMRTKILKAGPQFKLNPTYKDFIARTKKALTELAIRITIRGNKLPPTSDDQEESSLPNLTNQKRQAMGLMCRIYVGSINFTVSEDMIKNAFTSFGPVKNINMSLDLATNRHKGYAFLEFETPEAAYLALAQMDGMLLGGRPIKVGRPSNMPQADPLIKQLIEESKKYPRIYISSIHPNLTEDEVRSLFEPFGEIKNITMPPNSNRQSTHLGYCFIEYAKMEDADVAVNSMNLFQLMNLTLRVGKNVTPPFNEITNKANEERKMEALQMAQLINNKLSNSNLSESGMKFDYSENVMTLNSSSKPSSSNRSRSRERRSRSEHKRDRDDSPRRRERSRERSSRHDRSPEKHRSSRSERKEKSCSHRSERDRRSEESVNTASSSTADNTYDNGKSESKNMVDLSPEPKKSKDTKSKNKSNDDSKKHTSSSQKSSTNVSKKSEDEENLSKAEETFTISGAEARHMYMHKLLRPKEQRVVVLSNLIPFEELDDEIQDDIKQECERICKVEDFTVYVQENNTNNEDGVADVSKSVHFFVNCIDSDNASKLIEKMNGRFFSQRVVSAKIYDQELYEQEYFRVYD